MKVLCILLMVLTSCVLLLYPFVLMANIMAIAAMPPSTPLPFLTTLASQVFIWGSTLYAIPWLAGLVGSLICFRNNLRAALFWQLGVVGYLGIVLLAFAVWLGVG